MATCEETLNAIKLVVDNLANQTIDVSTTPVGFYNGTETITVELSSAIALTSYAQHLARLREEAIQSDLSEIKSFLGINQ